MKKNIIWSLVCSMFFLAGMMFGIGTINKYEMPLATAYFVAPENIPKWSYLAAKEWDSYCLIRPQELRNIGNNFINRRQKILNERQKNLEELRQ